MSIVYPNPFKPVKFEDETSPLLLVSDISRTQLTGGNFFFTGKRGCGKTSLLKVADTLFQQSNVHLRKFSLTEEAQSTFGVYINFNNRIIPNFNKTRQNKINKHLLISDVTKNALSSLFLELTVIRSSVHYLTQLVDSGYLRLSVESEKRVCEAINSEYQLTFTNNVDHMLFIIDLALQELLDFSTSLTDTIKVFRMRIENRFHYVLGAIVEILFEQTQQINRIRILIDDAETFDVIYQKTLNTLVRSPRNEPVRWSIAYVDGKYESSDTFNPNQTLSREDREVIYLDGLRDDDYEKFCVGVVQLRIDRFFKSVENYNVRDRLGEFSVEELIATSFKNSSSKRATDFWQRFLRTKIDGERAWQFYLREQKVINNDQNPDGIRKKMSAAYIGICGYYRLPVYYAGFSTSSYLSDGCIRDFLEQMASIFSEVVGRSRDGRIFLDTKQITLSKQSAGLKDASARKINSISDFTEKNGYMHEKLIKCLGELVRLHQYDKVSSSVYSQPNKAIFSLRVGSKDSQEYLSLIKDAEVDGYLRKVELAGKRGEYRFRLHRQFAPYFEISHRQATDAVIHLDIHFLKQIAEREMDEPKIWAKGVYENLSKNSTAKQPSMLDALTSHSSEDESDDEV